MSLNIHFFLRPLPIGTPSHWLFVSCSRLSPSTGLCRTRHPPTIVDYHDTPAVTGGLHPLLDIAPMLVLKSDGTTGQTTGQPKPVNRAFACPVVVFTTIVHSELDYEYIEDSGVYCLIVSTAHVQILPQ